MKKTILTFIVLIIALNSNSDNLNYNNASKISQFQQFFHIPKNSNDWEVNITDNLNIDKPQSTSYPMTGVYTNGSIYLIIYSYSYGDDSFEGVLLNKSNGLCVSGVDAFLENNKWSADYIYDYRDENSQDCIIEFSFNGNYVTINNPSNCYDLNSTLSKSSIYTSPSYGTYYINNNSVISELQITEIEDDAISFSLSVDYYNDCKGNIPENGEGTKYAFGVNGAYVFNDWKGCSLLITFIGSNAIVTELSCDLHGADCTFSGIYKKQY